MTDQVDWKLFLVVALIAVVVISIFTISGITKKANEQKFFAAENQADKCKTPAGYTDKEWKEHMGHHPDRYAECLG